MVLRKMDIHMQNDEVGPLPHSLYKINSKRSTGLNVRAKTTKHSEENTGVKFCYLGLHSSFLDMTP